MKTKGSGSDFTNVFEIALHQEFRKLELGEPDKKIRRAIDRAAKTVTLEVKRFMQELQKEETKARKRELKKIRNAPAKRAKKKTSNVSSSRIRQEREIVSNILA